MSAGIGIRQCLCVAVLNVVFLSNPSRAQDKGPGFCPQVGPDIFGDVRQHFGCILHDAPEDKMKPGAIPSVLLRNKTSSMPLPPPLPAWLEEISNHLLSTTELVNNFNQEDVNSTMSGSPKECGDSSCPSALWSPQCCRVEIRLLYPLFGRSLTTQRLVRIAQDLEPNGIQQPVVYRHCLTERTTLVRGRCHQSILPRLFYVHKDGKEGKQTGGFSYRQDLILVPSNCECLVNIGQHGNCRDDDDEAVDSNKLDTSDAINVITLSPSVEGSGVDGNELEPKLQEDELFTE